MASQASALKIVFGAMTVGQAGLPGCRQTAQAEVSAILDKFQQHGHCEVDTSRASNGTSEALLGQDSWQERGLKMQTKIYPTGGTGTDTSLEALQTNKVDLWYLHAPDRNTPLEDTMREVDQPHKEGKFERLGISNFMAWEVARMWEICDRRGWIRPSVYQGLYNPSQLENNLADLEKGPFPDDIREAFERAWQHIQHPVRKYWH